MMVHDVQLPSITQLANYRTKLDPGDAAASLVEQAKLGQHDGAVNALQV